MTFDANSLPPGPPIIQIASEAYHVTVEPESYSVTVNTVGLQGEKGNQGIVGPAGPVGPTGATGGSPNYLSLLLDVDLTSMSQNDEYYFKFNPNTHKWNPNDIWNGGNF